MLLVAVAWLVADFMLEVIKLFSKFQIGQFPLHLLQNVVLLCEHFFLLISSFLLCPVLFLVEFYIAR